MNLRKVAGVVPAAGNVDRAADRLEGRGQHVLVDVVGGGVVDGGLAVREVGGLTPQPGGHDVGSVALGLEESDVVLDELAEQVVGGCDAELRGDRFDAPGHLHPVVAGLGQAGQVQGVNRPVGVVPPARGGPDPAAQHFVAFRVTHAEGRRGRRDGGHEVGVLGLTGRVADLVDADLGTRRSCQGVRSLGGLDAERRDDRSGQACGGDADYMSAIHCHARTFSAGS
ncbi:hypothetical protein Slala03_75460 [Streptomyces lavendulae subsp. lavendulae]|nr:hypothetical protein Slala03_75460 [Streptomyces lavendulae subsp. lavendulae]